MNPFLDDTSREVLAPPIVSTSEVSGDSSRKAFRKVRSNSETLLLKRPSVNTTNSDRRDNNRRTDRKEKDRGRIGISERRDGTHPVGSAASAKRSTAKDSSAPATGATLDKVMTSTTTKSSAQDKRPRKHLDKIDLLDVTGIIGGGFHHDGPFDACNPNRNKNTKRAPVLAFAKDSTAMSMAAGPPIEPRYFGDHIHDTQSFNDYGGSSLKTRPVVGIRSTSFDPTSKVDPIHGSESVGLGTSTFLEGAPASRSAMMSRTISEESSSVAGNSPSRPRATSDYANGLGRKKSVLQKIRGAYRDRQQEGNQSGAVIEGSSPSPPSSPAAKILDKSHASASVDDYFRSTNAGNGSVAYDLTETVIGSNGTLSPLYRPPINCQKADRSDLNGSTHGLIKRVRSLRVGVGANRRKQEL